MNVIDSRGNIATSELSIVVNEYSPISILSTAQKRVESSTGADNNTGAAKVKYSYSPLRYRDENGLEVSNAPFLEIDWLTGNDEFANYVSNEEV